MDILVIYRGYGRRGSGWFVILITSIYLQYTKFPWRSDRESVIMNDVYPCPCLEEERRDNLDVVLIGRMTGVGEAFLVKMVVMSLWMDMIALWMGKGGGSEDEMLQEDATYSVLIKSNYHILSDNLYCKIALEKRILVFVVLFGVQRHAFFLSQSTSLIPNFLMKRRLILYHKGEHGIYNYTVWHI